MKPELVELIKKFLHYSFGDVDYEYDSLTPIEQTFCTPEEFSMLIEWLKADE
jgi:hypothetical protein